MLKRQRDKKEGEKIKATMDATEAAALQTKFYQERNKRDKTSVGGAMSYTISTTLTQPSSRLARAARRVTKELNDPVPAQLQEAA